MKIFIFMYNYIYIFQFRVVCCVQNRFCSTGIRVEYCRG